MIVSILGVAGIHKNEIKKAHYICEDDLKGFVKEGEYINSTHALLENYTNSEFMLIGTKESIEVQSRILTFHDNCKYYEYDQNNLNELFEIIFQILNKTEGNIYFDITHGFRDSSIMAIITTIINQFIQNNNIKILFAREVKKHKIYQYIQIDEYIDISKMSFILTTFKQTLKVPLLTNFNSPLYLALKNFSENIVSNQFNKILNTDYPKLIDEIKKAQNSSYSFLDELLESIYQEIRFIEDIKDQPEHIQFFYLAKLFFDKKYYLHVVSYLVEGIPLYVFNHLKNKKKLATNIKYDYYLSREINNKIAFNNNFSNLYKLRNDVKNIRNNLAHINIEYQIEGAELKLGVLLEKYEKFIVNDYLSSKEIKTEETVSYKEKKNYEIIEFYEYVEKEIERIVGNKIKVRKFIKAIYDGVVQKNYSLNDLQMNKLNKFIDKNKPLLNVLNEYKTKPFVSKAEYIKFLKIKENIKNEN